MYRFLLLSLLPCILVVAETEVDFMAKCGRLLHPKGLSCCKTQYLSKSVVEDLKDCMEVPSKPPPSCEREICMAKKRGFASDDGTIDKAKLKALFEKEPMEDKELQQALIEDCVDGDLSEYGPPDFCDLMKLHTCMHLHYVVLCPEWSSEGHCSGSAEAAEECIKALT